MSQSFDICKKGINIKNNNYETQKNILNNNYIYTNDYLSNNNNISRNKTKLNKKIYNKSATPFKRNYLYQNQK